MMAEEHWPTWEEIRAKDKAAGRIDEAQVAEHRERMRAVQRAHRLAEIRKAQGLTQTDVAEAMSVSQRRVSAVERGDLTHTELGTVASYVEALGGRAGIVANFGDEHLIIGLYEGRAIGLYESAQRKRGDGGFQPASGQGRVSQARIRSSQWRISGISTYSPAVCAISEMPGP